MDDRSNGTPVAIYTSNTQILVSKYHSPIKNSRTPEEVTDSMASIRKIQGKPVISGDATKWKGMGTCQKTLQPIWWNSQWPTMEQFEQENKIMIVSD